MSYSKIQINLLNFDCETNILYSFRYFARIRSWYQQVLNNNGDVVYLRIQRKLF